MFLCKNSYTFQSLYCYNFGRSLSMPGIQVSFVHNAKFSYIHLGIDCIQQNFQSLAASIEFMTRLHLKMSVAQTELNLVILGMRTPCSWFVKSEIVGLQDRLATLNKLLHHPCSAWFQDNLLHFISTRGCVPIVHMKLYIILLQD